MGTLKEIVIDSDWPARLARFWAEALDDYALLPYDDAEIERLAALGFTPDTDPSVMLVGSGPRLCFQFRQGPRPERNRLHFDIEADDVEAEAHRLVALGASAIRRGETYIVLADPEGNNFCVVAGA